MKIIPGMKMKSAEAKATVDELYRKGAARWEERVTRSPFMQQLIQGKLPLDTMRLFFKNWGAWTIEINTLTACSYHRFLPFFKRHRDLMAPLGEKIADEFMHPKPPGHYLVMMETAKAFGLTEEEVFTQPLLSEFRAKVDFARSILYEGSAAEWYSTVTTEERIGYWAGDWFKALTIHYGFTKEQAVYFSTHHEADLEEHEEGVMGHGQFNRMVLQRLLEDGMAEERTTYGMEYCAMTSVDLHAVMQRTALEEAERLKAEG
jgi:pyrroloquinoline quinone (PQQ) biosynthesis protein C